MNKIIYKNTEVTINDCYLVSAGTGEVLADLYELTTFESIIAKDDELTLVNEITKADNASRYTSRYISHTFVYSNKSFDGEYWLILTLDDLIAMLKEVTFEL